MGILKKKAGKGVVPGPTARLQVGNYIIKEWPRSAAPDGKVYGIPVITVEDVAKTWRVSVEPSHSRYALLQTLLHWGEVSPDGSDAPPEGALRLAESVCLVTFFMTTEDFMGADGPDGEFFDDVTKAMASFMDRRVRAAEKAQTEEERASADAEALQDVKDAELSKDGKQ